MVVEYVEMNEPAAYGHSYHAILVTGNARGWGEGELTQVDEAVDDFLKSAEPASHDRWGSTPRLKKKYKRGCVSTVKSLSGEALREMLKEVVEESTERDGEFVDSVAEHLPSFGDMGDGDGGNDTPDPPTGLQTAKIMEFDGEHWRFEGSCEVDNEPEAEWRVEISVVNRGEDDAITGYENLGDVEVPADEATVERATAEKAGETFVIAEVVVSENISDFEFRGRTEAIGSLDPWSGHGGKTGLRIRKKQ
jgi:hypothetical protein